MNIHFWFCLFPVMVALVMVTMYSLDSVNSDFSGISYIPPTHFCTNLWED